MNYLGDFRAGSTVRFNFTTHAADGSAVAPLSAFEAADLIIYKNGSATQRASVAGVTMTSPFDSIVGLHHVDIDLSDNTDAGFFSAGSEYSVVLSPDETVDGKAVVKEVASFSIENRVIAANVVQLLGTAWLAPAVAGTPDVNLISSPNATALTAIGTAVWDSGTRTLSSFGSLVSDMATAVWGATSRTLSAFGFTVNTNANATETATLTAAAATKTTAELLVDLLQADQEIDTNTTPWQLVWKKSGTQTELLRKSIKTVAGGDLTSTDSIPGRILQ